MPKPFVVAFCPGAVTAGTAITLPTGCPPVRDVIDGTLFRGSDGTAAAAEVAAVISRVAANQVKLDVATTTRDVLVVSYWPEFEQLKC